jgi:F0F1-type ATP synthase assembly protein I
MPELVTVVVFVAVLFAIEIWYVRHNQMTISEHAQRLNARLGSQLVGGIWFLLGAIVGWFVCHFSSAPPGG